MTKARTWLELARERGNVRAREVLLIETSGKPLVESMRYMLSATQEDRYVGFANRSTATQVTKGQAPQVINAVTPLYPQALVFSGIGGKVEIELVIDTEGNTRDLRVVSSPHPLLSEAALKAMAQWKFRPGMRDGHPVNTRAKLPLEFYPKGGDEQVMGVDQLIDAATGFARQRDTIPEADYISLRFARPLAFAPPRVQADGTALPADHGALLLLVLDAEGKPQRGYVLHAEPTTVGEPLLAAALQGKFVARQLEGKPVPSNVVFMIARGKMAGTRAP